MIPKNSWKVAFPAVLLLAAACTSSAQPTGDVAEGQARLEHGQELVRQKHYEEAGRQFTAAVKANPELAEGYYERGKVEVQLRLDPLIGDAARDLEQRSIDDFSMAIRKNPAYADAYFNRAMVLCSRAQYKLAVDDLLNAVRFNPHDPEAHRWLGDLYEKKFEDRIILAMEHYEKYIDLGGFDSTIREKVRVWKDFKKQIPAGSPEPTNKIPTAEDERKAVELHAKALDQLKNPDKSEAVKSFEELLAGYGHTKYVQSKLTAIQAAISAFKKKDAPK